METKKQSLILDKWTHKLLGAKMNYRLRYFHQRGHFPNLNNPKNISEILIKQLFDPLKCAEYAPFVDKLAVRDYLCQKGFKDCLLEHYGVWSRPEDITLDSLPDQFILKSNNGCGHHIICRDKSIFNKTEAIIELHHAIESGINHVEPHYHFITPRVYAEELIDNEKHELPIDYKFTCINGELVDIFVATDRASETHYCTFNADWEPLPYIKKKYQPNQLPERPKHLTELIEVAHALSKDFKFVRVDLYEYHDKPYFSELTFFPWGGLLYGYTDEAISLYGKKWRANLV